LAASELIATRDHRQEWPGQRLAVFEFPDYERRQRERKRYHGGDAERADAGTQPYADGHENVHGIGWLVERKAKPNCRDDAGKTEGKRETVYDDHRDAGDDNGQHHDGLQKRLVDAPNATRDEIDP